MIKQYQSRPVYRRRQYIISIILALGIWLLSGPIVQAAELPQSGAEIFQAQCAGCHIGGGNIIRRGKNLKLKTLQRYQVDRLEAVQTLVANGQGNMSAYADRLTPEAITAVSAYVLAQAAEGWPSD